MAYLNGNSGQATAKNGNSIDADDNVVLGNDVGDVAMEAALENDREIVDNGHSVIISAAPASAANNTINSQEVNITDANSNSVLINPQEASYVSAQGWSVFPQALFFEDSTNNVAFGFEALFDNATTNANYGIFIYTSTASINSALIFLDSSNIQLVKSGAPVSDSGIFFQIGGDVEVKGALFLISPQTLVNGSVSGTALFTQPEQGASYKKVIIYLDALDGTADYTFPTAYTFTPVVLITSGLSGALVTTLDTLHVEVTGSGDTGFLIIEGF
jgi:hypothetical protein